MIDFSLGKLMVLALIALLVLGPEKLPGAARTAGALLRRVRNSWENVRAEVERELEIEEIKSAAREASRQAEALQSHTKDTLKQVREPVEQAARSLADEARSDSEDTPPKPDTSNTKTAASEDPGHGDV